MDLSHTQKMQKMIENLGMVDINSYTNLESLNKYVKKSTKNIYACLHPSGETHAYHTHDFYEINYVYEGDCTNIIEGEKIYMEAGDFIIMSPGIFHTVYAETYSIVVNILIRPTFFHNTFLYVDEDESSLLSAFISKMKEKNHYKYYKCKADCIIEEIASLIEEEAAQYHNSDIILDSIAVRLICNLLRNENQAMISGIQNTSSNTIMSILEYMNENYTEASLAVVSDKFGYTPAHLCRMFSKHTGKTFGKILTEIRINKAIELLCNTNLKIFEISDLLGYNSHEYFQRLFKSHLGVTPQKYRQSQSCNSKQK